MKTRRVLDQNTVSSGPVRWVVTYPLIVKPVFIENRDTSLSVLMGLGVVSDNLLTKLRLKHSL